MAVPPEAVEVVMMATAITTVALQYLICKKSGTWFFIFGLLCSCVIAISILASLPRAACLSAQAVADIGVLLAGCMAFASSVWLHFAFRAAGEHDGR